MYYKKYLVNDVTDLILLTSSPSWWESKMCSPLSDIFFNIKENFNSISEYTPLIYMIFKNDKKKNSLTKKLQYVIQNLFS